MHIEIFEGKGGWYWHFRSRNGRIVSNAEAFTSRQHAIRAAKQCVRAVTSRILPKINVIFSLLNIDGETRLYWA